MKSTKLLYSIGFTAIAIALLLGSILLVANRLGRTQEVTSTSILEAVSDQYFIVTKTVLVDQNTKIVIDEGSRWSNLLWGQTIEAEALIRVDIGVDLSELEEEDIHINHAKKTVTIAIPEATVLDASQFGDIEVTSTSGILKFLLDSDANEDHNLSLERLIEDAETSVMTDRALFEEAREDSISLLELIIKDMGYTLEIEGEINQA